MRCNWWVINESMGERLIAIYTFCIFSVRFCVHWDWNHSSMLALSFKTSSSCLTRPSWIFSTIRSFLFCLGYYPFCESSEHTILVPSFGLEYQISLGLGVVIRKRGPFVHVFQRETTNKVVSLEEPPFIHKFHVRKDCTKLNDENFISSKEKLTKRWRHQKVTIKTLSDTNRMRWYKFQSNA